MKKIFLLNFIIKNENNKKSVENQEVKKDTLSSTVISPIMPLLESNYYEKVLLSKISLKSHLKSHLKSIKIM